MNKTCSDCIHYDVCMDYTTLKGSEFAQKYKGSDVLCDHFKDESRYIELPCAVGDKIYRVGNDGIKEFKVSAIESVVLKNNYKSTYLQFTELDGYRSFDYQISAERLEDDFFRTKEEAEQALLRKGDEGK